MDFGEYGKGKYQEKYVRPQEWFYQTMISQLMELKEGAIVLDLGAGPGTLAKLADEAGLKLNILGVEPSDLVKDGEELAERLTKKKSGTNYMPLQGSMEEAGSLHSLEPSSLDGIVMMRSAHEIAKSIGKEKFKEALKKLAIYLKPEGSFYIGDPTFREEIVKDSSGKFDEEVKLSHKVLEGLIGHSHPVEELISPEEMKSILSEAGYPNLDFFDSMPNEELLEEMRKLDSTIDRSPLKLYVIVLNRKEVKNE